MSYPWATAPTHDQGVVTNASGNATRDTAISNTEGRLIRDVSDVIFVLDSTVTPFTTVLTSVGKTMDGKTWKTGKALLKAVTGNPKFEELEDQLAGRYAKVSGTYAASGAVTITVTGAGSSSAYIFTVGDVFMNFRTGERLLVATVASSTTITVAAAGRAFGTTAAGAGADGDALFIVGNVNEENGVARNVNTTRVSTGYNYTQIFKTTISVSGTENAAKLYGGPDLKFQKEKKGIEHARDIERAFLFGERILDTNGTQGKPRRATGGVREGILTSSALVQDQNNLLTAPDLNAFLREGFTYGSNRKTLMCGGLVLGAISEIARGQLRTAVGDQTYGLAVNTWVTPFGTIDIVHNPIMVAELAGEAFLLDMDCFRYRMMAGRDTQLQTNIQAPDMDGEIDQFLSEVGLERRGLSRCALLRGVTG